MRKDMEELIGAVKRHRALWDISTTASKDHTKRLQAWKAVAEECSLTVESAKSKWRGLRDTYIKFLKSQKRAPEQGRKRRKKYCYAEQMEFMKPLIANLKPRPPRDQEVSSDTFEEPQEEFPQPADNDEPEFVPPKRYRPTTDSSRNEAFEILWKNPNQTSDGEMDAIDMLFLSYAKTLKTFSKRRQIQLKKKLAQVFADAELDQTTEDEVEFISPAFMGTLPEPNGCKSEPST